MSTPSLYLVLPHQLFEVPPIPEEVARVVLLEEPLFFSQYSFHRAKLVYHRATMRFYADHLRELGYQVSYLEHQDIEGEEALAAALETLLEAGGVPPGDDRSGGSQTPQGEPDETSATPQETPPTTAVLYAADPVDDYAERRLRAVAERIGAKVRIMASPAFLLSLQERGDFAHGKKSLFMADFYRQVRRSKDVLMEEGEPAGGSWSFDSENRKKLPRKIELPEMREFTGNPHLEEAAGWVEQHYPDAPGSRQSIYPATFEEARRALADFLSNRLDGFGPYQDAVEPGERMIFHSLLSPAINAGLLTPQEIVDATLAEADRREIPLNSLEGYLRQIIGWREFMLLSYEHLGRRMRSRNYFGFDKPMPGAFYTGETGLDPVDEIITRVLESGYAHHIERLMFLGNPMLLCEIDPDEVYRWFMELFVDAYDWVMVPNVYAMSQFADGGLITTKPYVSSSNYIRKMSPWKKGNWATVWDGLFWRFVEKNRELFEKNPRMSMMAKQLDRMGEEKLSAHRSVARGYLEALHGGGDPAAYVAGLS